MVPPALALQVPPGVASLTVVLVPWHILPTPRIADGSGFTSIGKLTVLQVLYIAITEPAVRPVTMPVDGLMDAEPEPEAILQVPPVIRSVSIVALPTHTVEEPLMAVGAGVIVVA